MWVPHSAFELKLFSIKNTPSTPTGADGVAFVSKRLLGFFPRFLDESPDGRLVNPKLGLLEKGHYLPASPLVVAHALWLQNIPASTGTPTQDCAVVVGLRSVFDEMVEPPIVHIFDAVMAHCCRRGTVDV